MRTHYVVFRVFDFVDGSLIYNEILAVVHFESYAKNICEFLNNNYNGIYSYKEVDNYDFCTRYKL